MTDDRAPSDDDSAELQRLLRRLGQSTVAPPHASASERAREERLAALIDGRVAELARERRGSWRVRITLLSAAAVVLAIAGARHLAEHDRGPTIEQEPPAFARGSRPATPGTVEPPNAAEPAAPPIPVVSAVPSAPRRVASTGNDATMLEPAASPLAQENLLFKEAAQAARTGDVEGALTRLERLLAENPRSPLAQSALVRKFRVLSAAGRAAEARREAERYLAAYPTGFAVAEAEAIREAAGRPREPKPAGSAEP